jgi:signal peptidase II
MSYKNTAGNNVALILAIVIVDQLSKLGVLMIFNNADYPDHVMRINAFFNVVLVWNDGVSFGLFKGLKYGNIIFTVIAFALVIWMWSWLRSIRDRLLYLSTTLLLGGAFGNIIDRLIHGAVEDFMELHAGRYYWPAFNLADSAITLGGALFVIRTLITDSRSSKNSNNL